MKNYRFLLFLATLLTACGAKQQYFEASPEIDLMKKADEAYYKGDWATLRSLYADTAKVNNNKWFGGEVTIDQFIDDMKANVANYAEYKQGEMPIYEMVVNNKGEKYVHSWQLWTGKHKNGKEVSSVVHLAALFVDNKIAWLGVVNDSHPFFEAEKSDSTASH